MLHNYLKLARVIGGLSFHIILSQRLVDRSSTVQSFASKCHLKKGKVTIYQFLKAAARKLHMSLPLTFDWPMQVIWLYMTQRVREVQSYLVPRKKRITNFGEIALITTRICPEIPWGCRLLQGHSNTARGLWIHTYIRQIEVYVK